MHYMIGLLVLGPALAVGQGVGPVESGSASAAGKVLVLDNGRTLDGDIERHGQQYRIRRQVGEVWVPANPEMKLCGSWEEAYDFMAARANLLDPDERLRLARWCHLHGMRQQAFTEVTAAVKMRPKHAESLHLLTVLDCALKMEHDKQVASKPSLPQAAPPPPSDISSDSVALFATRVQPVLMNTCVSCHCSGKGGDFQLYRSYHGGTQAATQKNLAVVLAQVDADHPILSPLLIKAVSAHGNSGQAPIKSRHSEPYRALQEWVDHLLVNNPHLQKNAYASLPQKAKTVVGEPTVIQSVSTLPPPVPSASRGSTPIPGPAPAANPEQVPAAVPTLLPRDSAFSTGQPVPLPEPVDEFDAAIFNRQMHSGR